MVLTVVVAAHVGVIVEEAAVVRVATAALGSTPEVGVGAETAVAAGVVASRKRTEACSIVIGGCVAHGTGTGAAVPSRSGCQRLGDIRIVTPTHILDLATHIVGQLCPLRIARHVPSIGADALHPAGVGAAGGGITHHRLPVVQEPVGGHIRGTVVGIVPICRSGGGAAAL